MALSVAVLANEADGAGLVWRAINKAGSSIYDLANVAGGCTNGQILHYQTSNSTWICTTPSSGSGFTNIVNLPSSTAKILHSNSSNKAEFKSLTQGTGITITNGSTAVTIANAGVTSLTGTAGNITVSASTGAVTINTGSNIGNSSKLSHLGDVNGVTTTKGNLLVADGGLYTSLAVGTNAGQVLTSNSSQNVGVKWGPTIGTLGTNITSTSTGLGRHTLVMSIPLTTNTVNMIYGQLGMSLAASGTAAQIAVNTTASGSSGHCLFTSPTAAATVTVDVIRVNNTKGAVDTAETATPTVSANDVIPYMFECAIRNGPNAGNARVWIQSETSGTAVTAKAGSFYIKNP